MASEKHDPYPELLPVREALKRLYDAVVAPFPFVPESPPVPNTQAGARALIDQGTAWALGVCEAYGYKEGGSQSVESRGLLGCWGVLESPDDQRKESDRFGQQLRSAKDDFDRDVIRNNRPLTTTALLGEIPNELVWPYDADDYAWLKEEPFESRYVGLTPNLGLPMAAAPWSAMPKQTTAGWWDALCNSWRELHAETSRHALRLVRWVHTCLESFDSLLLPEIDVVVYQDAKKQICSADASVKLAGIPHVQRVPAKPAELLAELVNALPSSGVVSKETYVRDDLVRVLPELWSFLRVRKAGRNTKKRADNTANYFLDERMKGRISVLFSETT